MPDEQLFWVSTDTPVVHKTTVAEVREEVPEEPELRAHGLTVPFGCFYMSFGTLVVIKLPSMIVNHFFAFFTSVFLFIGLCIMCTVIMPRTLFSCDFTLPNLMEALSMVQPLSSLASYKFEIQSCEAE